MSVYVDGLAKELAVAAVAPAKVSTLQPANVPTDLPTAGHVVVRHIPGGVHMDPRFGHVRATVQVDAYHSSKKAAFDLCAAVLDSFRAGWRQRTATTHGYISGIPVDGLDAPAAVRFDDDPDGFTRYTAYARLYCRP